MHSSSTQQAGREFFTGAHGDAVRGWLHLPATPSGNALVLTHGAGSDANAPLLIALAEAFCQASLTVLRCNLPFRMARPGGPPPRGSAERDQKGLQAAVTAIREQAPGKIFLGGHSYGGRQATMLAAAQPGLVKALLLLSYPLHPPQRPSELRTAHFPMLRTPALFIQGTRDGFATVAEMADALKRIPARTQLMPIENAGHELATKRNRDELAHSITEHFLRFIREVTG